MTSVNNHGFMPIKTTLETKNTVPEETPVTPDEINNGIPTPIEAPSAEPITASALDALAAYNSGSIPKSRVQVTPVKVETPKVEEPDRGDISDEPDVPDDNDGTDEQNTPTNAKKFGRGKGGFWKNWLIKGLQIARLLINPIPTIISNVTTAIVEAFTE